jgi:hypothetical protein
MRLKMATGGTAHGEGDMCATCKFASRRRAAHSNREVVRCELLRSPDNIIPEPLAECSDHQDANHPSIHAMKEIAWLVNADKKSGKAGFLTPGDYKKAVEDGKAEKLGTLVLPGGMVEWED